MNDVKLQSPAGLHPLDENLRPLKIGDKTSPLELSDTDVRVNGDLEVIGDIKGNIKDMVLEDVTLDSLTTNSIVSTDLTIDDSGDITLDAAGGDVNILQADVKIPPAKKLYLDGGGDTYFAETSADNLRFVVGGDIVMIVSEAGNAGNLINFVDSCAGFTQHEPTFHAADTNVYFSRAGNKALLTFDGDNIVDVHLTFPNASCNCVLLIKQDGTGSRLITNYKTFDQAGGNESTVLFSGGSNPTLTTTADKLDIISFYWDNDSHKAYGVASLNF